MSIDINWETLTGGPDGAALAETVRLFIHDRFQQVTLPRFIRSVEVHSFDFGTVAPRLELKDVCDPLPDFYDDDDEGQQEATEDAPKSHSDQIPHSTASNEGVTHFQAAKDARDKAAVVDAAQSIQVHLERELPPRLMDINTKSPPIRSSWLPMEPTNPLISRSSTPGIPGGTSNLNYFHMPLSAGLSGTGLSGAATPLAAFGGTPFGNAWPDHQRIPTKWDSAQPVAESHRPGDDAEDERNTNDVQIVSRINYSGDIKLSLTAEILLDYPMPSFVGIPLELNVTGMTFDGVAILAYIKQRAHFCFLSPEDADALIGGEEGASMAFGDEHEDPHPSKRRPVGGLFEEIKVESQIGQKANGKQVLKNVGKVEAFVLEQVRRIFENEFIYPSYWTFLV